MSERLKTHHADLNELLNNKITAGYVRAESVIDGVRIHDEKTWQKYLYQPGGWNDVRHACKLDLEANAKALHDAYPDAKILIVLRDPKTFIESVYRYAAHQMPWRQRSFIHYLSTPSGLTQQLIGYESVFAFRMFRDVKVLRYEDLCKKPTVFMLELCRFAGVPFGELPKLNGTRIPVWLKQAVP